MKDCIIVKTVNCPYIFLPSRKYFLHGIDHFKRQIQPHWRRIRRHTRFSVKISLVGFYLWVQGKTKCTLCIIIAIVDGVFVVAALSRYYRWFQPFADTNQQFQGSIEWNLSEKFKKRFSQLIFVHHWATSSD